MNPTVALPGSMTWTGIRLSSGSRRPQSPKGLPLHLLNRFSVTTLIQILDQAGQVARTGARSSFLLHPLLKFTDIKEVARSNSSLSAHSRVRGKALGMAGTTRLELATSAVTATR